MNIPLLSLNLLIILLCLGLFLLPINIMGKTFRIMLFSLIITILLYIIVAIMNNNWDGWRMARIELHKEDEHYAVYEGFIRLPDKAFEVLREELDMKEFDKLPYLRFDYEEKEKKIDKKTKEDNKFDRGVNNAYYNYKI